MKSHSATKGYKKQVVKSGLESRESRFYHHCKLGKQNKNNNMTFDFGGMGEITAQHPEIEMARTLPTPKSLEPQRPPKYYLRGMGETIAQHEVEMARTLPTPKSLDPLRPSKYATQPKGRYLISNC